jgi:hypothetical protein
VNLAVICGLISALSYGIGDYLSQIAGRAVGVWRTYQWLAIALIISRVLS